MVCAIGHETDYTLSELVADLRASTPTKAALEVAPSPKKTLDTGFDSFAERLHRIVLQRIQHQRETLQHIQLKPQHLVSVQRQRLEHTQ